MSSNHQFDYPDIHHLSAAEGWLDLGSCVEARRELRQLTPALRYHPEVLVLQWQISAKTRDWAQCLTLARSMTRKLPADPRAWILLAQSFYLCGQVSKAYETALSKVNAFPEAWPMLYDLARYSCLLGKRNEAHRYLYLALAIGDRKSLRRRALTDPDLEDLWKRSRTSGRQQAIQGQTRKRRRPALV
jgi:predicted Zn-dependent protease